MERTDTARMEGSSHSTQKSSSDDTTNNGTQLPKARLAGTAALLDKPKYLVASSLGTHETLASTCTDPSPAGGKIRNIPDGRECAFCKAPFKAQLCSDKYPLDCIICRGIQAIIYNCQRNANLNYENVWRDANTWLAMQQQHESQQHMNDIDTLKYNHQQEIATLEANTRQALEALASAESAVYILQEQLKVATTPKDDNAYWLQAESHQAQISDLQKELAMLQRQAGDRIAEEQAANSVLQEKYNLAETEREKLHQEFSAYRRETDERFASLSKRDDDLRRDYEEVLTRLDAHDEEDTKAVEQEQVLDLSEPDTKTVREPSEEPDLSNVVDEDAVTPTYLGMIAQLNEIHIQYEVAMEGFNNTEEEIRRGLEENEELCRTLARAIHYEDTAAAHTGAGSEEDASQGSEKDDVARHDDGC